MVQVSQLVHGLQQFLAALHFRVLSWALSMIWTPDIGRGMHTYIHIDMHYVCVNVNIYVYTDACTHVFMCVCMYVFVHVSLYIHVPFCLAFCVNAFSDFAVRKTALQRSWQLLLGALRASLASACAGDSKVQAMQAVDTLAVAPAGARLDICILCLSIHVCLLQILAGKKPDQGLRAISCFLVPALNI